MDPETNLYQPIISYETRHGTDGKLSSIHVLTPTGVIDITPDDVRVSVAWYSENVPEWLGILVEDNRTIRIPLRKPKA